MKLVQDRWHGDNLEENGGVGKNALTNELRKAERARRWASANIGAPERLSDVHLTLKLRLLTLRLYLSSRQKEKGGTNHHEKNDLRRRGFVYGIFRSMLGRCSTGLPVERLL